MKYKLFLLFTIIFNLQCAQERVKTVRLYADVEVTTSMIQPVSNLIEQHLISKAVQLYNSDKLLHLRYKSSLQILGASFIDEEILNFIKEKIYFLPMRLLFENGKLKQNLVLDFKNLEYKKEKINKERNNVDIIVEHYNINLTFALTYQNPSFVEIDYNDTWCIVS